MTVQAAKRSDITGSCGHLRIIAVRTRMLAAMANAKWSVEGQNDIVLHMIGQASYCADWP